MKRITAIILGICLLFPATAAAGNSSTCQAYSPQLCSVVSVSAPNTTSASPNSTAADSASTLPFTGLDVVLLAAGGGILLGAGLLVRRLASPSSN